MAQKHIFGYSLWRFVSILRLLHPQIFGDFQPLFLDPSRIPETINYTVLSKSIVQLCKYTIMPRLYYRALPQRPTIVFLNPVIPYFREFETFPSLTVPKEPNIE